MILYGVLPTLKTLIVIAQMQPYPEAIDLYIAKRKEMLKKLAILLLRQNSVQIRALPFTRRTDVESLLL